VSAYGQHAVRPVPVWRELDARPDGDPSVRERTASRVLRGRDDGPPEVIGVDLKHALTHGLARNCVTCDEQNCASRAGLLQVLR
jgi:hypothetical protein